MKKINKTTKRLQLNGETLRSLDLQEVTGGTLVVPTKPQASCFILCLPSRNCPVTHTCPLATAAC